MKLPGLGPLQKVCSIWGEKKRGCRSVYFIAFATSPNFEVEKLVREIVPFGQKDYAKDAS